MARAIVIVLDSFGIGGAPDAARFGDEGSNTYGHIARACAEGRGDRTGLRAGPIRLPNMVRLGLNHAALLSDPSLADILKPEAAPGSFHAAAEEVSNGKDTPSGHWEIAGVPVPFDWGYFPNTVPAFPEELTEAIIREGNLPGILGNCHASGIPVIEKFGAEHVRTGKPICYTSVDSVLQIAAHEEAFGLERLYDLCKVTRKLCDPYQIGRVIARPFVGTVESGFERTHNRKDFAIPPPEATLLDRATAAGRQVIAVGKIGDIFTHRGISKLLKGPGNMKMFDALIEAVDLAGNGDFVFANFVDFDTLFGHQRDVPGYAHALEEFDARLPELTSRLRNGDLLLLTADHGNDPTWRGTDHTRERIPVFGAIQGATETANAGIRGTFADIGETVARHLGLEPGRHGTAFGLPKVSQA